MSRWSPRAPLLALAFVLLLGLAVRFYDLTDPPLEFHPLRQLRGAITARYLYYRWNPAATPAQKEWAEGLYRRIQPLEPPVTDALTALTYLALGREVLWVARVYTVLFWLAAAVGLFALARRWFGPWPAVAGVLYFLFLPFAVLASRSFQPDPLMLMLLVWTVYHWDRWLAEATPRRAWVVGALSVATVLAKPYAVFSLAGAAGGLALWRWGWRGVWRQRALWLIAAAVVAALVGFYGLYRGMMTAYARTWTVPMARFWLSPLFYGRWLHNLVEHLGGPWLLAAAWGWALTRHPRAQAAGWGWAVGYGVYGMLVPYQSMTHSYYHLPLLPWVTLGLAALAAVLAPTFATRPWWARAAAVLALSAAVVYAAAATVRELAAKDYRAEPAYWQEVVTHLPPGKGIGLIQDFGLRLNYFGGKAMDIWPTAATLELQRVWKGGPQDLEALFRDKTQGYDYFLVTAMGQWERQPALREILTRRYPIIAQGEGYIVFDLRHPKDRTP